LTDPNPVFKVRAFLKSNISKNDDIFNDLDGPLPGFQGHSIFEVECLKNGASYRTKLL